MAVQGRDLRQLIEEGTPALLAAFGGQGTLTVRREVDAQGFWIHAVLMLPPDYAGDPDADLHTFKERWWVAQRDRSAGRLVWAYARADVAGEEGHATDRV